MATTTDTKSSEPTSLRVILGTMTFSTQVDHDGTVKQLHTFIDKLTTERRDRWELDTARKYGKVEGDTERMLAAVFEAEPELRNKYIVASKINAFPNTGNTLRPESVEAQATALLADLKTPSVDILYLHAPDHSTPIEVTLAAVQKLYEAGKFRELGLSNYAAWQVVDIWHICDRRGWVKPTLYQGMYNAITRDVERELFPVLRKFNIRFYAFNPLAGGFLTGKHKRTDPLPSAGRFWLPLYRDRYWMSQYFDAIELIQSVCDEFGIAMGDAALRWMNHHSKMRPEYNDGIIIGASCQEHLEANVASTLAGPLPQKLVTTFDDAWQLCKPRCPSYFK